MQPHQRKRNAKPAPWHAHSQALLIAVAQAFAPSFTWRAVAEVAPKADRPIAKLFGVCGAAAVALDVWGVGSRTWDCGSKTLTDSRCEAEIHGRVIGSAYLPPEPLDRLLTQIQSSSEHLPPLEVTAAA